jgi:hypothetical protein
MHDPGELQAKLIVLSDAFAAQLPEKLQQSLTQLSHTDGMNAASKLSFAWYTG